MTDAHKVLNTSSFAVPLSFSRDPDNVLELPSTSVDRTNRCVFLWAEPNLDYCGW